MPLKNCASAPDAGIGMNAEGKIKVAPLPKPTWFEVVMLGAEVHLSLQQSFALYPPRDGWEDEFLKRLNLQMPLAPFIMDELWKDSDDAGREFDRLGGKKPMSSIVTEVLRVPYSKRDKAHKAFDDYQEQVLRNNAKPDTLDDGHKVLNQKKSMKPFKISNRTRWLLALPAIAISFFVCVFLIRGLFPPILAGDWLIVPVCVISFFIGIAVAPLRGKRFIASVAGFFMLSLLVPPWEHSGHKPAGFSFLFAPPPSRYDGVQIDFGRLILEWLAIATISGMIWFFMGKPMWWPSKDKASRRQKFIPPPGNPEN